MEKHKDSKYYLCSFLKIAPLSHALWRSVEALAYSTVTYRRPVLDVGCGFGEFAGVVFNTIEVGIDINNDDLVQASKSKKYQRLQWVDARKMPFASSRFSTVFAVSVLEHIDGVEDAIREIHRVMKKDGCLIFSVPTKTLNDYLLVPKLCRIIGMRWLGDRYVAYHSKAFKHQTLRSAQWWIKQLHKNGFTILRHHGTVSPTLLRLHELFLLTALPSQLWKWIFGKRLILSAGLRARILPLFFMRFVHLDRQSSINVFIVAKKK